jgi:NADH:ubiquinone oxidoreductase subunit F (NADH-binding)/NADH:ubiquinone oxidoreductase subunit E/(2Fe-2S) ferredoxin/Pyruvate/2-oxoacid:ferredoxin oxidoreductase delta subunit
MADNQEQRILTDDAIQEEIDRIVGMTGRGSDAVIPILHAIQNKYKYLPRAALDRVCQTTDITPAAITGVSTFYSQFRHTPVGKHIIQVCTGTACHVKGAEQVVDAFYRELDIPPKKDTDPNGQFTIQRVACLGCCTLAPVLQIDGFTYGHASPNGVTHILDDFLSIEHNDRATEVNYKQFADEIGEIRVGLGSCCVASGSGLVQQALNNSLQETGIHAHVKRVGCVGMCHRVPLLEVVPPNQDPILYDRVQANDVKDIILRHFKPNNFRDRLANSAMQFIESLLAEDIPGQISRHPLEIRDPHVSMFLERQQHIATEYAGEIDPLDLEEYRRKSGFLAVKKVLTEYSTETLIQSIKESGLRGRGGAGFPTGEKWSLAHKSADVRKFIICNGDEGDPGAFMDRMILESYPFRVIEGMIIAAYAIGSHEGYLYIRAEYPLAVQRIQNAISQCEEAGLLGKSILGSEFSLSLKIMQGAGAFVCGEETALIASIEGKRGMPSFRPPYPVQQGLWGHSTLVNNCETYALVPWIIRNGPEAFQKLGTEKSKGTKVFSLAGKIKRGGLIEVPMGITIREIVNEIGGGIENGRHFKAVQIGGPSGGCVPATLADTKVDYEDLLEAGAMMGSGGLLVMDDTDCMVDIARYFLTFTCDQSCGKCTHCRIGTRRMLDILEKLCRGEAKKDDLGKLEELAYQTRDGSLCGLGKTAPNPVLTTLIHFREEYEAHLDGICPAGKCQELINYHITEDCIGCTICAQKCPVDAIPAVPYQTHEIIQEKCTKCDICRQVCPHDTVEIVSSRG